MFSGMRPLPLQGRHCCILSLILRPPPPTLSTKPRPPHSWHGTSTETVSSTEVRSLPVIPACSAGMPSPLTGPRPRPPSVHRSVTAAVARPCPWLRPHYRTHRSRRSNGSVAPPACPVWLMPSKIVWPTWCSVTGCALGVSAERPDVLTRRDPSPRPSRRAADPEPVDVVVPEHPEGRGQ
jgi:hypothetical protein